MDVEASGADPATRGQGPRDLRLQMRAGPRRSQAAEARVEAVELALDGDIGPDLRQALFYWRSKQKGRLAPARADIEPLDLAPLLPRVMLVDVHPEPLDFRYRLAGTGIFRIHGAELTNTRARDLKPAAYGALIHRHYCEVVARGTPVAHRLMLEISGASSAYVRIILPLSDDGAVINRLMTVEAHPDDAQGLQDCFSGVRGRG